MIPIPILIPQVEKFGLSFIWKQVTDHVWKTAKKCLKLVLHMSWFEFEFQTYAMLMMNMMQEIKDKEQIIWEYSYLGCYKTPPLEGIAPRDS